MNSDLISRKALKDKMEEADAKAIDYEMLVDMYEKLVDDAPTAEPDYIVAERAKARQRGYEDGYHTGMEIGKTLNPKIKQGEWIVQPHSMIIRCSLCGHKENAKDVGTINPDKHFCSFCGAAMQKGSAV